MATTQNHNAMLAIGNVTGLSVDDAMARLTSGDVLLEGELVANPEVRRVCRDVLSVLGAFHVPVEIYRVDAEDRVLRKTEQNRICVTTVERVLAQWQRVSLTHCKAWR